MHGFMRMYWAKKILVRVAGWGGKGRGAALVDGGWLQGIGVCVRVCVRVRVVCACWGIREKQKDDALTMPSLPSLRKAQRSRAHTHTRAHCPLPHTHARHKTRSTGVDAERGRGAAHQHRAERQVEPRRARPERLRRLHVERRRRARHGAVRVGGAAAAALCVCGHLFFSCEGVFCARACARFLPLFTQHAQTHHRRHTHPPPPPQLKRAGRSARSLARSGT